MTQDPLSVSNCHLSTKVAGRAFLSVCLLVTGKTVRPTFRQLMFALLALALTSFVSSETAIHGDDSPEARKSAANRKRNLIFNNDGDDALHYAKMTDKPNEPASKEGLMSIRMDHMGDCGLDSVFYCTTQSFDSFTHDSKVTEVFTTKEGAFSGNRTAELIKMGADPLAVSIEASRRFNLEAFYTIRVNDIHDNFWYEMISQWKKDNPHLILGKREDKSNFPVTDSRHVWTLADFAKQEVRDRMVTIVEDIPDRFDVDGIDLDFLRHPAFFQETRTKQPATSEHMEMLTDMMAKIRQVVLAASRRKGKPILLSVRVLPTLELNRYLGFDVERWVKEGYVDFIAVGGGYDPFTMPVKEIIERGHKWGIPVYVCGSASGLRAPDGVSDSDIGGNSECWRAFASNAWHAGADGLMTFNLFPSNPGTDQTNFVRQVWREMSEPKHLVGKDKLFCIDNLESYLNLSFMFGTVPVAGRLPIQVDRGETVQRVLPVGDDIPGLEDRIASLNLRVFLAGLQDDVKVSVQINGTNISMAPEKAQWLAGTVSPRVMKQGDNMVSVAFESGNAESLKLSSIELAVKYKR